MCRPERNDPCPRTRLRRRQSENAHPPARLVSSCAGADIATGPSEPHCVLCDHVSICDSPMIPARLLCRHDGEIMAQAGVGPFGQERLGAGPRTGGERPSEISKGFEMADPYTIRAEEISGLTESAEVIKVVNAIISAESRARQLPLNKVKLTPAGARHSADGKIDGRTMDVPLSSEYQWIPSGSAIWQFKKGTFTATDITNELTGATKVNKLLKAGWTYCLAISQGCGDLERTDREDAIKEHLKSLGLKQSQYKYRLYTAQEIAEAASRYPTVRALDVFGRPFGALARVEYWEGLDRYSGEYVWDESHRGAGEQIREYLRGNVNVRAARIEGPAGVGKSRLALEVVRQPEFKDLTIHFPDRSEFPNQLASWLRARGDTEAIIVVDECESDQTERLIDALDGLAVRLITIGVLEEAPRSSSPSAGLFVLTPLDSQTTKDIVRRNYPDLSPHALGLIADLSEGYVKLAMELGRTISSLGRAETKDLLESPSVSDLLVKMIPDQEDRHALKVIALGHRMGWEDAVKYEGQAVAEYLGLGWRDVQRRVQPFTRQGLVSKRGRYRYITPELLARWLAAEAWKEHGEELIGLMGELSSDPRAAPATKAMLKRLGTLGRIAAAERATETLLRPDGPFGDIDKLDDGKQAEVLGYVADANPTSAIDRLVAVFDSLTAEQLRDFRDGRRHTVWTLEKLAWLPETFDDAARLLLRLAEAENETWANNATAQFQQLFRGVLHGTGVPYDHRFRWLSRELEGATGKIQELLISALGEAFQGSSVTRGSAGEQHASRAVPSEANLQGRDRADATADALALMATFLDQGAPIRAHIISILSDKCRRIMMWAGMKFIEILEGLRHVSEEERASLRISLENTLHFDGERMPAELADAISKLVDKFAGSTIHDRVRRWIGQLPSSDWRGARDAVSPSSLEIPKLAADLIAEPDAILAELEWLTTADAGNAFALGQQLGLQDSSESLLEPIVCASLERPNVSLAAAYLHARAEHAGQAWLDEQLERISENVGYRLLIINCTCYQPYSRSRLDRILHHVSDDPTIFRHLYALGHTTWVESVPGTELERLCAALIERKLPTTLAGCGLICDLLQARFKASPDDLGDLAQVSWRALSESALADPKTVEDYHWGRLAETVGVTDVARMTQLACEAYMSGDVFVHDAPDYFRPICEKDPKTVWQVVTGYLEPKGDRSYFLRNSLEKWLLSLLPSPMLLTWADKGGIERVRLLAALAPVEDAPLSELNREIIIRYGKDEEVLSHMLRTFRSGAFWGHVSDHERMKADIVKQWQNDPHPAIRKWASQLERGFRRSAKDEALREAEEEW